MKLKKIKLKHFAKFEKFELEFNDDITHLIGMNGDGKTTVGLTAIWAGFKGIAEKSSTGALIGQRFRFITEGKKSLDVEITLYDERTQQDIVLTRHITKSTNTIKIEPQKGGEVTKEYVENLFNVAFLSASHFAALTGKQQAAAMGMDTTKFDKDLKEKKDDAAGYRRDIKNIGTLTVVEECEKKSIDVLQAKFEAATEHNTKQTTLTATLSTLNDNLEDINKDIHDEIESYESIQKSHKARLKGFHEIREEHMTNIKGFPLIEPPIPLKPINADIADIVTSNEKYFKYEQYKTDLAEKEEAEESLKANILLQKDIQAERSKYLQSKSFGIKGLQIDEDGNLTKDDKLIRGPYFSRGELEVLVARIAMNLNPELKVRFVDDFEMLDDINQEKLIKNLMKKGFQIITATVGNKKKDDKSVLLRACKVADGAKPQEADADEWDEPDDATIYSNDDDPENAETVKSGAERLTAIQADVIDAKEACKDPGVVGPVIDDDDEF